MYRTRVGYAGGSTDSPNYRRISDHTETIEIDYDPAVLAYEDLLAHFLAWHDAGARPVSNQYRSAIFYRTEAEWAAATHVLQATGDERVLLHTAIEPLDRFWMAEAYHQKYRLRGHSQVYDELLAYFSNDDALVDSTSAARLNGWLEGGALTVQLERELPLTGLSENGQAEVRAYARRR